MNVIEMENIQKTYGSGQNKVRALSLKGLTVEKGDYLAIEGPSGCGKSTLVHIMGLLDTATTGTYRLVGKNVEHLGEAARAKIRSQHIGFIFQKFNLLPDLNVLNNVAMPLVPAGMSRGKRLERATLLLKQVGLEAKTHALPGQLSGGQQQRVAIARALVNEPDLLIADEPTGNLDQQNADAVMDLISDLQKQNGTTVVVVTHDPEVSSRAKRVVRGAVSK
ncbi:MAG TPA: ABC transporter ATP-binding protein [Candidatus Thermoplasmatota archaeon]|nr:ABC transporter ATP-binding protein [Candidatus Thermoplasmatota archaeon]